MQIGLIGYGKMGRLIGETALGRGHTLGAIIDLAAPEATEKALSADSAGEVFIDFSTPDALMPTLERACRLGKDLVIGTTGWTAHLPEAERMARDAGIGCLWSSNFSPAVQAFFRLTRLAARLADRLPECDIALFEAHHRHKLDSPSGTALTAAEIALGEVHRKTELLFDRPQGKIAPHQLQVASLRVGEVPGTHAVMLDFPAETVEVRSVSRSRTGFALGAVMAAEWLSGKRGFFCYEDIFDELIGLD